MKNYDSIFISTSSIDLGYMSLKIILNDSLTPISFGNDEINLYVIFENAYSGKFTIPKQTLNLPILHPLSNTNTLVNF